MTVHGRPLRERPLRAPGRRRRVGRPPEPNSLRSEAARRGVSLYQVRKERALLAAGQRAALAWQERVVCPNCNGSGFVYQQPTAQGVRAPGGGEALPIQGQSEGTP